MHNIKYIDNIKYSKKMFQQNGIFTGTLKMDWNFLMVENVEVTENVPVFQHFWKNLRTGFFAEIDRLKMRAAIYMFWAKMLEHLEQSLRPIELEQKMALEQLEHLEQCCSV